MRLLATLGSALLVSLTALTASATTGRALSEPPLPIPAGPQIESLPKGNAPVSRAPAAVVGKPELLGRLKGLQDRQVGELKGLDEAVRKRFKDSTLLSLKSSELNSSAKKIETLAGQLSDIEERRAELIARREFVDQLIFQIDAKWVGQPLQQFLEHTFLEMALTDLNDPHEGGRLWKFITYMSIAVREVPEKREDVLNVVESYMNWSTILDPKSPAEYLAGRDYTNYAQSESAKGTARDKVADGLEKKDTKAPKPAKIELKTKVLVPPPAEDEIEVVATTPAVSPPAAPAPQATPAPSEGSVSATTESATAPATDKTKTGN